MNKVDLALRLARKSHRSRAQAADQVDTLVYEILKDLKTAQRKPSKQDQHAPSSIPATACKEKP